MTSRSKRKGTRIENEIVQRHKALGMQAERVPLSGAAGGSYTGDVVITMKRALHGHETSAVPYKNMNLRGEVKARKQGAGFTTLERWLGTNDLLFLKRDRQDPMVVMNWDTYAALIRR